MDSTPGATMTNGLSATPSLETSRPTGFTFLNLSLTTWIILILVLAILGINIFAYLAKGTQTFADVLRKISGLFGGSLANITKQVTNISATGTKAVVDVAAGTINSGVDVVQETTSAITGANASSSIMGSQKTGNNVNVPVAGPVANNSLQQTLQQAQKETPVSPFSSDDATSAIQSSKASGKSGWCYIGEDRGFRSCIKVGENDRCMSGDIFPSQDICINPTLRQ